MGDISLQICKLLLIVNSILLQGGQSCLVLLLQLMLLLNLNIRMSLLLLSMTLLQCYLLLKLLVELLKLLQLC